jgi:hypothetical protein
MRASLYLAWLYVFVEFYQRGWMRTKKSKTESPTRRCPSFFCVRGVESRLFQEKAGQVEGTEVSVAPPASASASPLKALLAYS